MRRSMKWFVLVLVAIGSSGCEVIDPPSTLGPREYSRSMVFDDGIVVSRVEFDQVLYDGPGGTLDVSIVNLNPYCIWPTWSARVRIGLVDRTLSGYAPTPILPGEKGAVGTFSFGQRIDLANIDLDVLHFGSDPIDYPGCGG